MTYKTEDFFSLFSIENNPAIDTARKAGEATRDVVEGVTREQIAAAGELVDLGVKQFEALTSSRDINSVIAANQAWFNGSVEIVSAHATKSFKIVQDATGMFKDVNVEKAAKNVKKTAKKTAKRTAKKTARKATGTRAKAA